MASSNPRLLTGVVISDKADKTITVKVERKVRHPLYGKIMKRTTKVHAHDESNDASIGDIVTVKECRPISKSKTWGTRPSKMCAASVFPCMAATQVSIFGIMPPEIVPSRNMAAASISVNLGTN